jgi:hypothetical protein
MVNSDQIEVQLVPMIGKRTWENKGTKHIKALGEKIKKQVTLIVSSFTNELFSLQVAFTSTTHKSMPLNN